MPAGHGQVLLLHGLYTRPCIMRYLGWRLAQSGFGVHYWGYASVRHSLSQHSRQLAQQIETLKQRHGRLHLVGHSLGGLLIRQWVAEYGQHFDGRCVTLGTPHQGSTVARQVHRRAPGLLGAVYASALDGAVPPWPAACEWGSVAGSRNRGLGRCLRVPLPQSDGTVAVAETMAAGCRDHLVLPVGHTSMLFDRKVAQQVAHFLQYGCFAAITD